VYLRYCCKKTFTVYCKRRRSIFAHYFRDAVGRSRIQKIIADPSKAFAQAEQLSPTFSTGVPAWRFLGCEA
jgi:hypothetical protein